jgi:hypothetical protein
LGFVLIVAWGSVISRLVTVAVQLAVRVRWVAVRGRGLAAGMVLLSVRDVRVLGVLVAVRFS